MKMILAASGVMAVLGCANLREIQEVDMVRAQLIKIDTIFRHPDRVKQLTWKDQDDIQYVSYLSMDIATYPVGTSVFVMRKR